MVVVVAVVVVVVVVGRAADARNALVRRRGRRLASTLQHQHSAVGGLISPPMERHLGFKANHDDFIQDIAFDFYGERIASCSSDHTVKIWEMDDKKTWTNTASITGHSGTFHRLDWAHPEFGILLAACSSDHNVIIYEEIYSSRTSKKSWIERTRLVDSTGDVKHIKFSPRHLGLQLAACSDDGVVRIYEAINVMELSVWSLKDEIQTGNSRCNCVSWNKSQFDAPQLMVGSDSQLQIFEYYSQHHRWDAILQLKHNNSPVLDVDWANNLGRSFHLLAAGCKDGHVRIFKLTESEGSDKLESSMVVDSAEHGCEVWSVSWNISGTVLASSGDNGSVLLWKCGLDGKWICNAANP